MSIETISPVRLDTTDFTLVFDLRREQPELAYCGKRLPDREELIALCAAARRGAHQSQPDEPVLPSIFPQEGRGYPGRPALEYQVEGRSAPTDLRLSGLKLQQDRVSFEFSDAATKVELCWAIMSSGLIEVRTRLINLASLPITITHLASLSLPVPHWASEAVRFSGRWSAEMQEQRHAISGGIAGGRSRGGRPGFSGGNWIRLEEPGVSEGKGRCLSAHLAWSGDHEMSLELDADGAATLMMSAGLEAGEIVLAPGAAFEAPRALLAVSARGSAGLRQAFHREVMATSPVSFPRKVHLNSWEALAFDLSVPALEQLVEHARDLGAERFVLDDGWFEGRRNDTTSLGDWTPDRGLFPDGLRGLIEHVHACGMDFGLWVEPEMISPASALYRAHPDWCIHRKDRPRETQRYQLVLDLTRPEVEEHLFTMLDTLLRQNQIAYLKWDHNRELFPRALKGHAQTLALYRLLDRLRSAHPQVEIESCASGGGRVDLEILRRCGRYWASDNNDAVERLRINRSWYQFLPPSITGNHVGPSPNPITGRRLSMDFRAKVALFGHMGIEANPVEMTEGERAVLARHILLYKEWRDVVHRGSLYEIECGDPSVVGWLALNGRRGLALAAQTRLAPTFEAPPVRFAGLDPQIYYAVRLLEPWPSRAKPYLASPEVWRAGLVLSGAALAEQGLALPLTHPETAWLIALEEEE
jgi:alpha-galactosidase